MGIYNKKFISSIEAKKYDKGIVVDSVHNYFFPLSHWKGAYQQHGIQGETSTEIVLNAIEKQIPQLQYKYITNNHFDIDGFLGIWSLMNPKLAIENKSLFKKMAIFSDFRELSLEDSESHLALKLLCWFSKIEEEKFYPPYGASKLNISEPLICENKYKFFIKHFSSILSLPEIYEHVWKEKYNNIIKHYKIFNSNKTQTSALPSIRLQIIKTPDPLHYYALFSQSSDFDMVLSIYDNNRYELEYKYTTWVDSGRVCFPRIDMSPLAKYLNQIEKSNYIWFSNNITDTGPLLRLGEKRIPKIERFDHPYKRHLFSSSIPEDTFINIIKNYYNKAYQNIKPKPFWSWKEIHDINKNNKTLMDIC